MRAFAHIGLAAASLFAAVRSLYPIEVKAEPRDFPEVSIRPDRKTLPRLRSKRAGNKSGHKPHQGLGEIARRKRQITASQLRRDNGLVAFEVPLPTETVQ